jgi:hypothetical protein
MPVQCPLFITLSPPTPVKSGNRTLRNEVGYLCGLSFAKAQLRRIPAKLPRTRSLVDLQGRLKGTLESKELRNRDVDKTLRRHGGQEQW